MSFPRIVAFDTDWTLWQQYLDVNTWGRGNGASAQVQDNIERFDRMILRDRTNHSYWIRQYDEISNVIYDVLRNNAQLAIVSSNASKPMCDRALHFLNAFNPATNSDWSIVDLATYSEIGWDLKVNHFRKLQGWAQVDYSEMLMFDDEPFNNDIRITLGASFQLLRNRAPFTWNLYQQGLAAWRQARSLTLWLNPGGNNPVLIGYSGLPTSWINRIHAGEGIVEKKMPYRWGFGLYLTSSIRLAKYFRDWNGNWGADRSYVCQIWAKDYNAWAYGVPKIWVPESDGNFQQMDNMNWTSDETALNQENRDATFAANFGVPAPYALFSQHFWMNGMPFPRERFTEMVAGTQLFRTMFNVVMLQDSQVEQMLNQNAAPFGEQFQAWNIVTPHETKLEFARYGEQALINWSSRAAAARDLDGKVSTDKPASKETVPES
ncbi:acid phosphatase-domain-containing protein [Crepidotus variabilis]|uniref:Acid phosphatase-domain-containing protein n=1 Tax=Crepidotus variabilis TaxID=179855 RepID=A0A9P6EH23_9AGAR|nr:acid phosphatase-domain-containing protein [Crepidotus variabilis]